MILDFITGVRKASLRGEATTSRGFRRTAEKASQYFLPMMCLTAIDVIASIYLDYPYLTATMGAFNIYIELRSIWENTHSEEETKKQQECATQLIDFIDDDKNGSLFTPGDINMMVDKTIALLSNREKLAAMSNNAINTAKQYTYEKYKERIESLYSQL